MSFKFPFTNYHELNLTWVLDQLKKLFEESAENVSTIQNYDGRLTAVETELPNVSETASEASRAAAAAGTLAQTAKATADTAQENAVQAQGLAGTARQEAQAAQTAANEATQAAQQAQATAQNFDGRITQAENDASQALEASRSFENRVQSAITTANNAAQTATNAQGIAMRADQNAGAALDKIGDLSALDTTAKQNLVAAINEVLESGGAVDSVNGQTGAVVLDAGDIGYNGTTVDQALDGKQNAPTAAGTAGQVLGLDNNLQPVWVDQTGGGDTSNCAPLIINTASGNIASFSDGADNRQIRKIVATIEPVQSGTGDPSPDNVRPIRGWTMAKIYGRSNSLGVPEGNTEDYTVSSCSISYIKDNGTVKKMRFVRTNSATGGVGVALIKMIAPKTGTYYARVTRFTGSNNSYHIYYNIGGVNTDVLTERHSFTAIKGNTIIVGFYLYTRKNCNIEFGFPIISLEEITDDYVNADGTTLPITFTDPTTGDPMTIYGGTVTLNADGSADVVSAMGNIASYAGETLPGAWISSMDVYEEGATPTTGAQVVYELAEPVSYHFDDVDQLKTFLGTNNIWADTGDVEVTYPADTKLYIDNKIAELQALVLEQ